MNFDFRKTMQSSSTEDLVAIITVRRNEYREEAIAAAEEELTNRNYRQYEIDGFIAKAESAKEKEVTKALTPLETGYKILAFMFPGIITIIFSGLFKSEGYDKKALDLVKWTFYGLGFYVCLIIILSVF